MTIQRHHPKNVNTIQNLSGKDRHIDQIRQGAFAKLRVDGYEHIGEGNPHICCHPGDISISSSAWMHGIPQLNESGTAIKLIPGGTETWVGLRISERGRNVFEIAIHECGEVVVNRFRRGPWEYRVIAFGRGSEVTP